ncbi:hypothetical protein D3C83_218400 [compost metagenome]
MTLRIHRVAPWPDHVLDGAWFVGHVAQRPLQRFPGDRAAVTVQQAVAEQHLQHLRHAARAMEIHRDVPA